MLKIACKPVCSVAVPVKAMQPEALFKAVMPCHQHGLNLSVLVCSLSSDHQAAAKTGMVRLGEAVTPGNAHRYSGAFDTQSICSFIVQLRAIHGGCASLQTLTHRHESRAV